MILTFIAGMVFCLLLELGIFFGWLLWETKSWGTPKRKPKPFVIR